MPERVGDEEAVLLAPRRPLVGGGVEFLLLAVALG
jgi:hypothetical protein